MACTSVAITPGATEITGMRRSSSGNDLRRAIGSSNMRRSRSEPQLKCALIVPKASSTAATTDDRNATKKMGIFPFDFSIKSFLLDGDREENGELEKRANWVERLMELRSRWREKKSIDNDNYCGVNYDEDEEELLMEEEWDQEKFSRLLKEVTWAETKLFSKLAFLCNMAYVISDLKTEDLKKYYGLQLVTSSLEKKSEAAIRAELDIDSTRPYPRSNRLDPKPASNLKRPIRSSAAYETAVSAVSYFCSRTKGLVGANNAEFGSSHELTNNDAVDSTCGKNIYQSEMAAFMVSTTMTAVVAAEEDARLEAAKDLRSLHSSPCEWFVCDDPNTCIRCFVIQGSDSLASWQANLFFEPTKFEGTEVRVHRGIYEAAKGIYDQFMPDILTHLDKYGENAKFRFVGHSLGGSLSLLVNLMLHAREAVPRSSLLPVVTFGSPSVFCGGNQVIKELGLDEDHICSVKMHRDIVPRAFSCNYPNQVAQVLKRINGAFRSHPCLNNQKLLYSPMGKLFILQPDEKFSPPHPLLPHGAALYSFDTNGTPNARANNALKAFLNSPHPLETLSKMSAYGSGGTILRDHDSSNYLKAINGLIRQQTNLYIRKSRRQRLKYWWPLLTSERQLVRKEMVTANV